MAAGRPTVASAVGEVPAMLADGRGQLVPPGCADSLARALDRFAAGPELRERAGVAARAFRPATAETMVRETCALYRRLLHAEDATGG